MNEFLKQNMFKIIILFLILPVSAVNGITLPSIIGDNMVLQSNIPVPIWGTAEPNEKITVRINDKETSTVTDGNSNWNLNIGPFNSGGPFNMVISGAKDTLTINNILIGEVWVCSGQSNMAMNVSSSNNANEEVENANYSSIRLFTVERKISHEPAKDVQGKWVVCSPETVGSFSAVGYFFGKELYKALSVPVGLINSSWGGTQIEAWISGTALETIPSLAPVIGSYKTLLSNPEKAGEEYKKKLIEWEDKVHLKDPGNTKFKEKWADIYFNASDWKEMELPQYWEKTGLNIDGAVWFRKEVNIPVAWSGKSLVLNLGAIDDFDTTYFNGVMVGAIGSETPKYWEANRRYEIPSSLVKAGKNVITVRVFDNYLNGGFAGQPVLMKLYIKDSPEESISISGKWIYKVEYGKEPLPNLPIPINTTSLNNPNLPAVLYNGMIYPIIPFAIKGVIWYQGESNAGRAYEYRKLFPLMITDWRNRWNEGDFTFLFVQLANFLKVQSSPVEYDPWPELREAQLLTLKVAKTGMAVITDIGEENDIHPKNKQDVGYRLSLSALKVAFNKDLVYSGPLYESMSVENNKIRLRFKNAGSGLIYKNDGKLKGFAVCGEDKNFFWAEARIEGDTILVWNDEIQKPIAVRYNWANNPIGNLYNKEGLPASLFRTDDWPGVTYNK